MNRFRTVFDHTSKIVFITFVCKNICINMCPNMVIIIIML